MKLENKALKRYLSKITINNSTNCWEWNAGKFNSGYGAFSLNGFVKYAHRVSYEHYVGNIPENFQIDHLCRVRGCVNPEHLEPVTFEENIKRSSLSNVSKTHCINGHIFDDKNTYMRSNNKRECKECHRLRENNKYNSKRKNKNG